MTARKSTRNGFFNRCREVLSRTPAEQMKNRVVGIEVLEGRIAPAAVITVTLNDNNSGSITPGGTINYTEIISHAAGSDADALNLQIANLISNADFVPGSLNVSPVAFNDAFSAIGNTHLVVNGTGTSGLSTPAKVILGNLFANDLEFANDLGVQDSFTLASFTQPAQSGASVTVSPDGSFIYLPAAGFTGTDTFTYTITDDGVGGVGALSATATVTITVGEAIWYVDDSAAPGGTGRSNSPLQSLAPLNNGGALDGLDNTNDTIFVYSGSYTGGITLEAGQKLIGQGTNLVVDGVQLVTGSTAIRPTISQGSGTVVTLATGNGVRGLNVVNTSGGGISGNNVGVLSLSDFDITTTGGTALNITGSGTVTVTGVDNDLTATNGTALNVANVAIGGAGMTFKSISVNGGSNGIVLNNTGATAGLTVTGSGTTANSGGIIQNTTGDGISLQSTKDVSLNRVRLVDTGRHGIFGSNVDGFRLTNSAIIGSGDADEENGIQFGQDNAALGTVTSVGVRGTVLIQDTLIENATQWGLRVYNNSDASTLDMTLRRLTVQNNVGTFGEHAVSLRFEDGTANVLVDDSDFINNDAGFSAQAIGNNGAVMNVTIQNSVFDENLSLPSAVNFTTSGNATGRLRLDNNFLSGDDAGTGSSTLIDLDAADTSTLHAIITNNTGFDTGLGGALEFMVNDNATGRAEVRNNTFTLTGSNKTGMLFRARTVAPENNETGSLDLTLEGNTINNVNATLGGFASGFEINAGTSGSTTTHANTVRLNVSTASGAGNNVVNGTAGNGTDTFTYDFVVRQRSGTTFQLVGYTGSSSNAGAVAAFFDTNNPAGTHNPGGSDTHVGSGGTHITNYTSGSIFLPEPPTLPPVTLLFEPGGEVLPESPVGDGDPSPVVVDDGLLSQAELDSLVAEAKARWISSGLTAEQRTLLDTVTFAVADLGGRVLGSVSGSQVTIDNDGAGAGWFVDATPSEDSEFASGELVSRLDALTAVMHEIGHVLGLDDTYDITDSNSVMYGFLTFNTRRAPAAGEAIGAVPHEHSSSEYLFSPINTARNGAGIDVPITLPLGKTLTLNFSATVPTSTVATSVSAQATVTGTGINVVSNDPTTPAANDATITPINLPDVKVELLSGASVTEDVPGTLIYTFTREGATDFARTINFNVGGSATFGADYTQSGAATFSTTVGTVTFAEGQSTVTVTLTPTADSTVEANETAILTVASGLGYDVGTPAAATGTIVNDDTDVKVELLSGTSVLEDGATNLAYTFTRTGVTTDTRVVNFTLTPGTGLTSADYAILSAAGVTYNSATGVGTVTFNPGETTKAITLDPTADTVVEGDETATVTVTSGTGYNVTGSPATGTLVNDDTDVKVELLSGSSVSEDGATNLVYTFTRTGVTTDTRVVNFTLTPGTGLTSADYAILSAAGVTYNSATGVGTVTFNPGETTKAITLDPTADNVVEADETATVTVTSGTGYNVTGSPATGTLVNDDTDVKVELLSGTSVLEDGATNLVYTFTRTGVTTDTRVVNFTLTPGTGLTSADYAILSAAGVTYNSATGVGTVTFNPGETTKAITLDPTADNVVEGNETATVTVTSGAGYNVTGSPATGTLVNDDTDVKVELLSGTSVLEDGATNLVYTFTRTGVTTDTRVVNFTLTPGTGLTSADYAILSAVGVTYNSATGVGTVTFNPGETTKAITLDPTADNVVEADETATVTVTSGTGYNVTGSPATGTIVNDDANVTLSLAPASVTEDGSGVLIYTFTREGYTDSSLRVDFTVAGTATQSSGDYTTSATGGVNGFNPATGAAFVTFPAGATSVSFTVDPTADINSEPDETVTLTLGAGTGYTAATTAPVTGTILNDDTVVTLAVSSPSISEDGSGTLTYTFTRTGDINDPTITVNFTLAGTAAFGSDYTISGATIDGNTGTVVIPTGTTSAVITVTPVNDSRVEGDESIQLTLGSGTGYGVGTNGAVTSTITDNDTATVSLVSNTSSVGEDAGGHNVAVQLVITANGVANTGTLEREVKVNLADLLSGSATGAGSDYTFASPQTVTFASGAASGQQNVSVALVNDTRVEGNENIALQLGTLVDGSNGQVSLTGNANHTITVTDNDTATVSLVSNTSSVGEEGGNHNVAVQLVITANGVANTGTLEREVKVNLSDLLSGSATGAGSDYTFASPQTVTFANGAASSSQNVSVALVNDTRVEGNETIALQLGTLVDGTSGQVSLTGNANHTITVTDNDTATVSLVSNTSSVGEDAGSHSVAVQLVITANGVANTGTLEREVKVNLSDLLSGSATGAGSDYTFASPQTVTFASGAVSSSQNVSVALVNDTRVEGNETIALQLGSLVDGSNGQVSLTGNANHTITVTDNDTATVSLVSNTSSVGEEGGSHNVAVQLVITANGVANTGTLEREVKVNLSDLLSGTATGAGSDYTFTSPQTVTFVNGAASSSQNVSVALVNDIRVEGSETIALQLGSLVDGSNGQVSLTGNANHTITVTDNDTATVSLVSNTSSVGEDAGSHNVAVQLVITANGVANTGTMEREVKVNLADLLSGTATEAGSDYTFASPQTVSFGSGAASGQQNVSVALVNDTRVEGNETIALQLGSLVDGTSGQVSLTGNANHLITVTDNDTATVSLVSNTSSVGEDAGSHNVAVQLVITANGVANTGTLERDVKVNLSDLLSGSATGAGSDYTFASPQTVTFASGAASGQQNVSVALVNDTRVEGSETIALQLGSLVDGTAGQVSLTGDANHLITVTDNDTATVSLVSNTSSVGEDAGSHNVAVQLVITANGVANTGALEREVKVNLSDLLSGSATGAGSDYTFASPQTVTFANGAASSSQNVSVALVNDTRVEGNETIALQLGSLVDGSNGQVSLTGNANHLITVTDNDTATVSLVSNTSSVGEDAGSHSVAVQLVITANGVTNTGTLERDVKVNLSDLLSGSATGAGSDYTFASPQTVTFASGAASSSQNVSVALVNDTRVEGSETIALQLGSLVDGTAGQVSLTGDANHTITVTDNDTATVSLVSNTSSVGEEGGSHNVAVQLVITANGVANTGTLEREVKVNLADLLSGSATGAGSDYTFSSPQTVTFASGAASGQQNVSVALVNDTRVEGSETIALQLGTLVDGSNGQVSLTGNANHTITVADNDTATVSLVSNTSSVGEEGGNHNVAVQLVITANGVANTGTLEREVKVNLSDLLSGSATGAGSDYTFASPQTVTFASGAASSSQNVSVALVNDTRVEGNETIALQLGALVDSSNGQVSLTGDANHTITVTDNDTATVSLVSNTSTVGEEGGNHNVAVQLVITANGVANTGTLEREVKVNLSDLLSGTATGAGSDYTFASPQTVTFASGAASSSQNVSVALVNDTRVEGNETIALQLGSLVDGTSGQVSLAGNANHTITVTDNDTATVSLVSNTSSVGEEGGSHNVAVQLVITANGTVGTGTLERDVKVNLTDLLSGSATGAGSDYTFVSPQTVTFASGAASSSQNVSVALVNDTRVEGDETIALQLESLVDGTAGQVSLTGDTNHLITVTDNDTATVFFTTLNSSVGEATALHDVGVTLLITANGTVGVGTLDRVIAVDVVDLVSGTASGVGVDYTFTSPQTVAFGVGESGSTKLVSLSLTNDLLSEGDESVNLGLIALSDGSGSQVSLAAPTSHVVTITDNDIDLQVTKTESIATVVAGSGAGNLTYVVTVRNIGLTNASGVAISENLTLPAGVTVQSVTPSSGSFTLSTAPDGDWMLGNLAVGAEATLTVVLTVDSSAAEGIDVISNTASLTAADQTIVNTADDTATESTSIDRQVDLQLIKTDGITTAVPGGVLTYMLAVNNAGPSDATGVVLTETVPAGTTFNAAASSAGWVETAPGSGVFTYSVGTVEGSGSVAPVTFATTVNGIAQAGQDEITNTAAVSDDNSAGADLNPADNTATDINLLNAAPQFALTISDDISASVARGGLVRYTLTYSNTGNQDATGVYLIEHVPANATFDFLASSPGWELQEDGSYRLDVGNLAAGEAPQSVIFAVRTNTTIPAGTKELINDGLINDDGGNAAGDLSVSAEEATLHYQGIYVVSPGVTLPKKGGPAMLRVFDIATGLETLNFLAYDESYRDSVRIAVGDFNGDGFDDIVAATRTGTGNVRIFDGVTGERITSAFEELHPFNGRGKKGAYVEAGDVTGDGHDDIIVGSALGGGTVKIYDGVTGSLVNEYEAFNKSYRGGVRLAVADLNGDGVQDVVASQGNFGNLVRVFDGESSTQIQQIKVGGKKYRGGVSVAAGDVTGDGIAEIITGRSGKSAPNVDIFSAADGSSLGRFLALESKFRNGIRVAAADVNIDGIAEIIVGAGFKGDSSVKIFNGSSASGYEELLSFTAYPEYPRQSLFVAGTSPVPIVVSEQPPQQQPV